jgi:uncharacterized membrane protein
MYKNKKTKTLSLKVLRHKEKRDFVSEATNTEYDLSLVKQEKTALESKYHHKNMKLTKGQRAADSVTSLVGSWKFIIIQSIFIFTWISWNSLAPAGLRWDPPSFLLLNIMLSFQAAYTAPFIMMSENRQSQIDRKRAQEDFAVNKLAERENEVMLRELRELKKLVKELKK